MKKSNRATVFFINYAVKIPIIYFLVVLVGVTSFLYLTISTKVPIINTYTGVISKNDSQYTIEVQKNVEVTLSPTALYIYIDKNDKIYNVTDFHIKNNMILFTNDGVDYSGLLNKGNITIEVEQGNITLFTQIFVKGGKN